MRVGGRQLGSRISTQTFVVAPQPPPPTTTILFKVSIEAQAPGLADDNDNRLTSADGIQPVVVIVGAR